eukprot:2699200-Rhodomonas_salina.1
MGQVRDAQAAREVANPLLPYALAPYYPVLVPTCAMPLPPSPGGRGSGGPQRLCRRHFPPTLVPLRPK